MKRSLLLVAALSVAGASFVSSARAQTPKELARTANLVGGFQNADGGFGPGVGWKSSLGATSSALRILKYSGGSVPDILKCVAYVESCFDKASGGFAPTPGGTPTVAVTASGLMAITELKLDAAPYAKAATAFFSKNATAFEDVRIAVAGLEAIKTSSDDFPRWTEEILKGRNPDGTFGSGGSLHRETGGKIAALLRMGYSLDKRDGVLDALRSGQRPDGGWSRDGTKSDLETSYRIMRCFFMLKEKPDLDKLRDGIATFRQADGGYSSTAAGPADSAGTYYCSIMLWWARQLDGEPALVETVGFQPLFNGKDLDGWEGDSTLWAAKDGKIVGTSPGLNHNDFLATKGEYEDFILQVTFRMKGDAAANSGIQFRSVRVPGHEMSGYQADIGQGYWGCLYDESRRNKVLVPASANAVAGIHKDGWNHYVIRAMGDQITLTLNGKTSVGYRETDPEIARSGRIAVQIHAGKPLTVEFKNILIQRLPSPKADASTTPGFHLRTVATPSGPRKYAVYLPLGFDPKRIYPVVVFLHGSGERGTDGVTSAQIGLGAAILNRYDDFGAIGLFPQAQKTWSADSEDGKAAIAALDAVTKEYAINEDKVAVTGLSMGGRGAWEFAAADPKRWSAVVPICGRGRPETAEALKGLPIWVVCGDDDGLQTVQNGREMVKAIQAAGGSAKLTEYRAVGHNSWDRAYNDVALLEWMLGQTRKGRTVKGE